MKLWQANSLAFKYSKISDSSIFDRDEELSAEVDKLHTAYASNPVHCLLL